MSKNIKLVLTVHDLSFKRFPEFFSRQMRLWHKLINPKKLCKQSDQIVSVSENTKHDLQELYKLNPNKIKVICPGINPRFKIIQDQEKLKQAQERYALPANFILTVGTLEPRKNIEAVIKTFELLWASQPDFNKDLNLVIVGNYGLKYQKILTLRQKSKLADRIKIIKSVGHQDLPYIYNLAKVFLYLSFYEGFGLPPLEAAACGLPLIASYAPALPEILGDSALLVDPYNLAEIVLALKQVLLDNNLRQSLIKKGLAQAQQFNWDKTAEQILSLMKRNIGN